MATQNISYAVAKTAITVTLTSLANGSARQSAVVSNTANKLVDALIQVQSNGTASSTAGMDVYVYAALGDTTYSDAASGADAAFTASTRKNAVWIGTVNMNAATAVTATLAKSVASCFGGVMPEKWGLIFVNNSGAALSATAGDHVVSYQGIAYTVA